VEEEAQTQTADSGAVPADAEMAAFLEKKHADAPAPAEDGFEDEAEGLEEPEVENELDEELEDDPEAAEEEDEVEAEEEPEQQPLSRTKRLAMQRDEARQERETAVHSFNEALDVARNFQQQAAAANEEAVLYRAEAEDWKAYASNLEERLREELGYERHPAELENFQMRQQLRRAQLQQNRVRQQYEAEQQVIQQRQVQQRVQALSEGSRELARKYGVDHVGLLRAASYEGHNTLEGIEQVAKALRQSKRAKAEQKRAPRSARLKGGRGRVRAPQGQDADEARTNDMAQFLEQKMARDGRLK